MGLNYDPFVVFDGLTFVFVAVATYVVAKRLSGGSEVIGAVAGFGLVFASPLIVYVDEPWNSTVCLLAAAVILLLGTSPRRRWWHPSVMGLMVGARLRRPVHRRRLARRDGRRRDLAGARARCGSPARWPRPRRRC